MAKKSASGAGRTRQALLPSAGPLHVFPSSEAARSRRFREKGKYTKE
ncbi:putative polyketide synthase [Corchorus olitorius]|uniref:Polyketide synthase n=1 Tax=Corchorus olitorius TaxID=93759 RepID=A0A1R3JVJ4_9ROSI|nr:putative polyketide synthase [Corchorus olitorius]